jgi:hypothetical protein
MVKLATPVNHPAATEARAPGARIEVRDVSHWFD